MFRAINIMRLLTLILGVTALIMAIVIGLTWSELNKGLSLIPGAEDQRLIIAYINLCKQHMRILLISSIVLTILVFSIFKSISVHGNQVRPRKP